MNAHIRTAVLIVVLVGIAGGITLLESRKAMRQVAAARDVSVGESPAVSKKAGIYERAKEITTPDGFLNADDSLTIQSLIGKKVILVDFWTYSCINCQRTLPYLNSWYEKYADKGLAIIGIHTPEFEFEKEFANVKRATEKFGIKYPVVLDNDYSTWMAYKNRYWPRKYLIDIDGFIVYDHIGEGGYDETEKKIVELLNERAQRLGGAPVSEIGGVPAAAETADLSGVKTPETYLGAARVQYLANLPVNGCESGACTFTTSGNPRLNTFELSGVWRINDEEATLEGAGGGSILLHFSAGKVNLVAGTAGKEVRAEIYLDGARVPASAAGADVHGGAVTFGAHDLYNIVDLRGNYGEHVVEIRFLDGGVSAFAFTFG